MMRKTVEERVRAHLMKIGRKNKLLGKLILPILVLCMTFFHVIRYFAGNGKRLAMIMMVFFTFVTYSSFSFPLFLTAQGAPAHEGIRFDASSEIVLAEEQMVNLAEIEVFDEEGETSHGLAVESKYDAEEILKNSQRRQDRDKALPSTGTPAEGTGEQISFSKDDWKLVLINKQHSIPEDYSFELGTIVNDMKCDARIIDDLLDMLAEAKQDGVNLTIRSPYRSDDRQVYLFNRHMKAYMKSGMSYLEAYQLTFQAVTIPGASEHQIGLALDITCDYYDALNEGFGETQAGEWLAQNSYKYGFILRYPEGKEYITGIEYEPWHFRYVGADAATIITENHITLEEFWDEYVRE